MKSRKFFLPIMLIIIAMVVVACGGGDDGGDGGDNGGGDVNLSQSASYSDPAGLSLTMSYPEDWVANTEDGSINVANGEDVLSRVGGDSIPQDGEVGGVFSALSLADLGLGADLPLMDIYSVVQGFMAGGEGGFSFGDAEEFTTNGKSGIVAFGTGEFEGETADAGLYLLNTDAGLVMGIGVAPEGELAQYDDTFRAMLGTAEVTTAE